VNGASCALCRFFEAPLTETLKRDKNAAGECRVNAPTPMIYPVMVAPSPANPTGGQTIAIQGVFAPVSPLSWCARFEAGTARKGS
jgi:hypothetical protein